MKTITDDQFEAINPRHINRTTQAMFIIQEYRKDRKETHYVCARPGYMRCANGTYEQDGSFAGGPEWTKRREHAFLFKTHRSAARVQSKSPSSVIVEL